jgi:hypothetical protein
MVMNICVRDELDLSAITGGRVLYYGRPSWVGEPLLAALLAEARQRRGMAKRVGQQLHSPAGPVASGAARQGQFLKLVASLAGEVRPSGTANYLYYEEAGAGIQPHTDSAAFQLQVLLMLEHQHGAARSVLGVFPNGPAHPLGLALDPGELVLFRASELTHGRTPLRENETVTLLGIGYALPR